jgi:YesN/AraC family two-component response regulator
MLGMFVLFFLFSNYTFSNYLYDSSKVLLQQFLTNTSILWFLIALYVLLNPLILYGEQLLQKELTTLDFEEITVWSIKKWPTSAADRTVEQKIAPHVNTFLLKLKNYENQLSQDFTKAPTLKELCFYLNYPQSHIKYIFKYYSFYSFSEYINVLKVRYAITLIKSDYLSNHTIDSLSKKALFTNRSTFFKNFKSLTGYSPSEYILKVRN